MTDSNWSDLLLNLGIIFMVIVTLVVSRPKQKTKLVKLKDYPLFYENGEEPRWR